MPQMAVLGKANTKWVNHNGWIRVRLHSTDVVVVSPLYIILQTGGFKTVTTKNRMNQASNQFGLGYKVWSHNGVWHVAYKGSAYYAAFKQGVAVIFR